MHNIEAKKTYVLVYFLVFAKVAPGIPRLVSHASGSRLGSTQIAAITNGSISTLMHQVQA